MRTLFIVLTLSISTLWAEYWNAQQQWAEHLINQMDLKGHERILDLGCGTGQISAAISQKVPDGLVVGLDSSPSMIQFAEETFDPGLFVNLVFLERDISKLSYREEFDIVTSFSTLHWIPGTGQALRSGGKLYLSVCPKSLADLIQSQMKKSPRWSYTSDYFAWSEEELFTLLDQEGFTNIHIEEVDKPILFSSREEATRWIAGWLDMLNCLPEGERSTFLEEIIDSYICLYDAENRETGVITISQPATQVTAIKK